MRTKEVISELSPCDNDLTDSTIQTIEGAESRGPVLCTNLAPCIERSSREGISCTRRIAQQMAVFVSERLENGQLRQAAIDSEVQDYLDSGPDGKFWTFRNGKWEVANNKREAMGDIASFVETIIGLQDD